MMIHTTHEVSDVPIRSPAWKYDLEKHKEEIKIYCEIQEDGSFLFPVEFPMSLPLGEFFFRDVIEYLNSLVSPLPHSKSEMG